MFLITLKNIAHYYYHGFEENIYAYIYIKYIDICILYILYNIIYINNCLFEFQTSLIFFAFVLKKSSNHTKFCRKKDSDKRKSTRNIRFLSIQFRWESCKTKSNPNAGNRANTVYFQSNYSLLLLASCHRHYLEQIQWVCRAREAGIYVELN